MKKFILLFIFVVFAPFCFAQKGALVRITLESLRAKNLSSLLNFAKENPYFVLVNGSKETVVSSALFLQDGIEVQWRMNTGALEKEWFPLATPKNDALMVKSLQKMATDLSRFQMRENRIISNLSSAVYTTIPYENYLPDDVDYLFVGEIHERARVQREVVDFISSLPKKYPNRPIFVATEFIDDQHWLSKEDAEILPDVLIVRTQGELKRMLGTLYNQLPELQELLSAGFPLVGLEPQNLIINRVFDELGITQYDASNREFYSMLHSYATSEEGVRLRNERWAQHLAQLKEKYPDALIVVYGGAFHMAYQLNHAVPNFVQGKKFVTFFMTPGGLGDINPLFKYLWADKKLQKEFHRSYSAKMVTSWKHPTPHKTLLGADLTVIVHE